MSRIPPIPPREWSRETSEALLAAYRPSSPRHPVSPRDPASPKGLNAMGILAYHPELTEAFNHLISHALYFTTITPRQRELLVLRVASVRQSQYEWGQHAYLAGLAGLSPTEIERIRSEEGTEGWDPLDAALLSAADELVADARIGDDTYAVLSAQFDTQQIMDVVFTVGAYEIFAMALRTFEVDLDDDLTPYL
ncbi:MAG TPA: carboxymuconolactone decarboxylase family protein [Acidimicrobiales bacterium]